MIPDRGSRPKSATAGLSVTSNHVLIDRSAKKEPTGLEPRRFMRWSIPVKIDPLSAPLLHQGATQLYHQPSHPATGLGSRYAPAGRIGGAL